MDKEQLESSVWYATWVHYDFKQLDIGLGLRIPAGRVSELIVFHQ
jgi:hypothetical protein